MIGSFRSLKISLAVISLMLFCARLHAAEQAETARLIKTMTPPLAIVEDIKTVKDEWYVDGYYEPSDIIQGNRTGHWNEIDTLFGYKHKNINGYFSVSQLERFDIKDYTANFGSYLNFKDSYAHIEVGFGWDVDYIYRFQSISEYGHKLYKNLYGQMGYTYRGYTSYDTHQIYPGLIYYFGDSYMSLFYGVSCMESNDAANFATVRGDFAITKFLRWSCGFAFGERLYDIYGFSAAKEKGYILFTGLSLNLYKGITLRAGYSYGEEAPKFIKRGMNFSASVKF